MSKSQMEEHLKRYLGQQAQPVPARTLVEQLTSRAVRPSDAKMAMLRLANRGEIRVAADHTVELVAG